jgi:hypothetical protein
MGLGWTFLEKIILMALQGFKHAILKATLPQKVDESLS